MPNNNKRIAKNTGFLYVRMLLMMGIAFFSSRILLQELGVEDYGLYGVIGGVVAMFSSLRGIFASSIQRFLNFEMGRGNIDQLSRIFSVGVILHLILSAIFLLLAETLGVWFLNNKLVFASDRYFAANWVYQFSVATSIVTIMTVPYDAILIANERMKAFAYISILDASLKLVIIFVISYFETDKLILYGLLLFIVSVITRTVSMIYCKRNFNESRFKFTTDKNIYKEIGSFAGWNFLGNTSFTLSNEGVNMILNIFGGTTINAARAISYQVKGVTLQFVSNILIAVNPHMIKLFSQEKKVEFTKLFFFTSKMSYFVLFILCVPIFIFAETILTLWLVDVPAYSVIFVRLILIYLLIRSFHSPIDTLFKATGKIKKYQIIEAVTLFLNLPISYILLKNNLGYHYVFIVMIIMEAINLLLILILASSMGHLNIMDYLKKVIVPCLFVSVVTIPIAIMIVNTLSNSSLLHQFVNISLIFISNIMSIILLGFSKAENRIIAKTFNIKK